MRGLRIFGVVVASFVALLLVGMLAVGLGVNTDAGHRLLERAAGLAKIQISGLQGRFPDDFTIAHVAVADADGVWLEIDGVALDWSPRALLKKNIRIASLSAARVHVDRAPVSHKTDTPVPASSGPPNTYGFHLQADRFQVDRIEVPGAVLTAGGTLGYQDSGMAVTLAASTPDAAGQGPAALKADLTGPLSNVTVAASLDMKGLTTRVTGQVDITGPSADVTLGIDHPDIAGVSASQVQAVVKGDASAATLRATIRDLRIPGEQPALLGDGPVALDARYRKDASPEITATLTAGAAAQDGLRVAVDAAVTLASKSIVLNLGIDRLATPAASAGRFSLHAEGHDGALDMHSEIAGLTLPGVAPAMLGVAPLKIDVRTREKEAVPFSVSIAGDTVAATASGAMPTERLALDYHVVLPRLAAFAPTLEGQADLAGRVEGAFDDFALKTHAEAVVATQGISSPITGDIDMTGLPKTPVGRVVVGGMYAGEKVAVDLSARRDADQHNRIDLAEASWQGVVAKGGFVLAEDGGLPTGSLVISAKKLPPPASSGAASATIALLRDGVTPVLKVVADITGAAIQGASIARVALAGTVTDPAGSTPSLKANLAVDGVASGAYRQAVRLDVAGPANALAIRLGVTGTAALSADATLDAAANRLSIASLRGRLQGQDLRLTAPTTLVYAPQITLGSTRLALGGSTLDIAGRLSPMLDLTATLRAVPAELAKIADPTLQMEGSLQAEARLQGTTARPTGSIRLTGSNLRLRQPRGLPVLQVQATAELRGAVAQIDTRISSGATNMVVAGAVPIAPDGAYNLTARGRADLALLDPFLAEAGAQARGSLALDATITGREPKPEGSITLANGSVTLPSQGVRLADIAASIRARPDRVVIESLSAKAGGGTVTGKGSVELGGPMAIDITLAARNASPVSSDLLTARIDADLALTGAVKEAMSAKGTVRILRAEINIPQRLPSSLPVLAIRQKGPPPPPPAPEVPIALDIDIAAPGAIFVRGRGLDAELAGNLHVGGTASAPKPEGGFTLRRGQFSLAGQTLNFTTGRVFLDGHLPIDPSLDFAATALTSNVAATLAITGNASHPKIALRSVPELPQDEVLAQLLFRRSASDLGPLQLAQIAAALAQIADVGGSSGFDPLGTARKRLGLDVLSVGGAPGAGPTVEAGRNLGAGVYLGAKQSTTGSGSQATVRIDLARGLRAEADLGVAPSPAANPTPGAPPTGNQVGVTYEFEY